MPEGSWQNSTSSGRHHVVTRSVVDQVATIQNENVSLLLTGAETDVIADAAVESPTEPDSPS